jgi:signal transduction histidine kinase
MSQVSEPNSDNEPKRLLDPTRFWNKFAILALISAALLLGFGFAQEWQRATTDLRSTLSLLIRAGSSQLELGDYRSFTELSGTELGRLRFEIVSRTQSTEVFHAGLPARLDEICETRALESVRTSQVKICRPVPLPWVLLGVVAILLFLMAVLGSRLLRALEKSANQTLSTILSTVGVPLREKNWTSVAVGVRQLQGEIRKVRARETELQKTEAQRLLALRVTHDLRGPILALKTALKDKRASQELEVSALQSIERLGQELLSEFKAEAPPLITSLSPDRSTHSLSALGVRLKHEFPEIEFELGREIRVPERLESALENFMRNAAESYEGRAGRVHLWLDREEEGRQILGLRDWGKGIPEEIRSRLGSAPVTFGKSHGTGLGVFTAQKSIQESGGRVKFESGVRVGTQVWIEVPLSPTRNDINPTSM